MWMSMMTNKADSFSDKERYFLTHTAIIPGITRLWTLSGADEFQFLTLAISSQGGHEHIVKGSPRDLIKILFMLRSGRISVVASYLFHPVSSPPSKYSENMSVASLVVYVTFLVTTSLPATHSANYHDIPESNMNVTQIIRYNGYPAEEYSVVTDDGYIIYIQRIPAGRKQVKPDSTAGPKPVMFLQHGLLGSSSNWVTNLPNESFGFILADAGYDVWLGNVRGNTYGLRHVKYPVHSDEFWVFSWDEMARYDLPAMLKFVTTKTSQSSIYYTGHSQGTLLAFAEFSRNKELAKSVDKFFALGPVATVGYMTSPLKYLASLTPQIQGLFEIFGIHDFLPSDFIIRWFAQHVCSKEDLETYCSDIVFILCGFDKKQLNETRLPVYYSHTPAGTSVRNIVHFAQMVRSKKFEMYDYGSAEKNMEHYKQPTPPLYNASAMTVPVAVYWAQNDWLADPTDVRALLPLLPNKLYNKCIQSWDHMDFIWGLDAATIVYNDIIKNMRSP